MNLPMMKMLSYKKNERELIINIISEGGKTMINITAPKKSAD